MAGYYYDLHMHSCLSPCGGDQMTPPNMANMAYVKGLDIIAVTDHNSARNAGAVMAAAAELPVTVIPGIELCTAEEIHVVCLFPTLEAAQAAGLEAESCLPDIPTDEKIFGVQQIMDSEENPLGRVEKLLINATSISVDDAAAFAERYGGFCFPAHIDKQANSILAVFGYLPEGLGYTTVEVARPESFLTTPLGRQIAGKYRIITDSDAHQLEDISEPERTLELESCDFDGLKKLLTKKPGTDPGSGLI